MLEFLLLLLFFFIILPALRVMWRLWLLRRNYRRAQQQMNDLFNRTRGQQGGGGGKRPTPQRHKKIDPEVGEYVTFEEIRETETTHATSSDGTTRIKSESQVEDAVWEDIK